MSPNTGRTIADLRRLFFPALTDESEVKSVEDDCYNCIAWAANDTEHRWWPLDKPTTGAYWPPGVEPRDSVEGFVSGFRALGYEPCENGEPETGFEKLALYVDYNGEPSHMARRLPNGKWTSKIGDLEDIEHIHLEELCGAGLAYGRVAKFFRRPIRS